MPDDETTEDDITTSIPRGKVLQYRRPDHRPDHGPDHGPGLRPQQEKQTRSSVYINDEPLDRTVNRLNLAIIHLQRLQEQVDIMQASVKYFSIISGTMLGIAILLILIGSG